MKHNSRFARKTDYEGVSRLVSQIHRLHAEGRPDIYAPFDRPMGAGYYGKLLEDPRSRVAVVEDADNGAILAYAVMRVEEAAYRPIYRSRRFLFVEDFCVDENRWSEGIGRGLFEFIKIFAQSVSAEHIELGVAEFNTTAIRFYEKMGMQVRSRKLELRVEE